MTSIYPIYILQVEDALLVSLCLAIRCSLMGRVCVSSCRCCVFVSVVHPVAILNVCLICSLLMFVSDASGDHMITISAYTWWVPTISAYTWWNRQATNDACKSGSLLS